MIDTPSSTDSQAYLENLMRAGQDAMKQFDDALVSVAGVGGTLRSAPVTGFASVG